MNHKKRNPCLYIIKIETEEEYFLKIGLASNGVAGRFVSSRDIPYNFSIIKTYTAPPYILWDKEAYIKQKLKQYRYVPKIKFNGHTECFNTNTLPLIEKILNNKNTPAAR